MDVVDTRLTPKTQTDLVNAGKYALDTFSLTPSQSFISKIPVAVQKTPTIVGPQRPTSNTTLATTVPILELGITTLSNNDNQVLTRGAKMKPP